MGRILRARCIVNAVNQVQVRSSMHPWSLILQSSSLSVRQDQEFIENPPLLERQNRRDPIPCLDLYTIARGRHMLQQIKNAGTHDPRCTQELARRAEQNLVYSLPLRRRRAHPPVERQDHEQMFCASLERVPSPRRATAGTPDCSARRSTIDLVNIQLARD